MLVISRRKNESLVISDDVIITVVEIRGDKVRLGITAPAEYSVCRKEVHDALSRSLPPPRPLSVEEQAWLGAIADNPDDAQLRLVFAEWLEERGDPLGEYIRVQIELSRLPEGDRQRTALEQRRRDLWRQHGPSWDASLPDTLLRPRGRFFI